MSGPATGISSGRCGVASGALSNIRGACAGPARACSFSFSFSFSCGSAACHGAATRL